MFMLSFRLSGKRVLAGALVVALVAVLGVSGVKMITGDRSVQTSSSESAKKAKKITVKTNEQRVAFAQSFGWEVEAEAMEVLEVIIPKEFDDVYEEYNSMQKTQGYDLSKYAGKRCKRYTYAVTNHPQTDKEVRLNILVYDNKVIGGDVCSLELNGFMHGFTFQG